MFCAVKMSAIDYVRRFEAGVGTETRESMSDLNDLEQRIQTALAAITDNFRLQADAASKEVSGKDEEIAILKAQVESLEEELDKARDASAKVKALEVEAEELRVENQEITQQVEGMEVRFSNQDRWSHRLNKRNQILKNQIDELRQKNEQMVGDPDLINKTYESEVEHLKDQRTQDLQQVDKILADLTPLVEGQ